MTDTKIELTWYQKKKSDPIWLAKHKDANQEYARKHRKKFVENTQRWRSSRPWYVNAFGTKNRKSMPPWANREKIEAIYKEAYERGMTVDHIIPLTSSTVCGLHVDYNLQILSLSDNRVKSNQYNVDPTVLP